MRDNTYKAVVIAFTALTLLATINASAEPETVQELIAEEKITAATPREALDAPSKKQIVVITDPKFVPISQYFTIDPNNLEPSAAGPGSRLTIP